MSEPGAPAGSLPSDPLEADPLRTVRLCPIDSHCHLADEAFETDIVDVVLRARTAGSPTALCILDAGEVEELRRASRLRELWPGVRFAVGVHPMRAESYRADPLGAVRAVERALESTPTPARSARWGSTTTTTTRRRPSSRACSRPRSRWPGRAGCR